MPGGSRHTNEVLPYCRRRRIAHRDDDQKGSTNTRAKADPGTDPADSRLPEPSGSTGHDVVGAQPEVAVFRWELSPESLVDFATLGDDRGIIGQLIEGRLDRYQGEEVPQRDGRDD
jgi:hypothetical protein